MSFSGASALQNWKWKIENKNIFFGNNLRNMWHTERHREKICLKEMAKEIANSEQRGVCAIFRTGSMRVNFDLPNCCCCCCCRSASKITSFAEVAAQCFFLFFGCFLVVLFFFLIKCQLCVYGPPMQSVGMVGRAPPFLSLTLWLFMLSVWVFVGPT